MVVKSIEIAAPANDENQVSKAMISIVIPTYNRCNSVLALLSNIYLQEDEVFEVIVIDDCSCDDTVASVLREFPRARLIVNETNQGPCVARNRGIMAAQGVIVVGLDSDVAVHDRRLLVKVRESFDKDPSTTGIAFRILMADGITDDIPRWWHPVPIDRWKNKQFRTNYFSGTGYAFQRSSVVQAGLYPEILFMHYEEVVLAYRMLDNGGTIRYCPQIRVLHHAGKEQRNSKIQVYYTPRNQVIVALLCLPSWHCVGYLVPRLVYQFARAVYGAHLNQFLLAMRDVGGKIFQIIECRKPLKISTIRRMRSMRMAGGRSREIEIGK